MMGETILSGDVQRRGALINNLKCLMEKKKFFLRYQSIVPVSERSKNSRAYEVLIGVDNSSLYAPITVAELVKNLEVMGRSVLMDYLVLNGVINAGIIDRLCTDKYSRVHLNLSGYSLSKSYFLTRILRLLYSGVLPPHRVCFELTETAKIENMDKAAIFLRRAKQLGCSFALDDFGQGYSSLDYFVNLPIDTVKIDGSIVKSVVTNSRARAALRSIVSLAADVGASTVAECVENLKQLYVVKAMGVDFIQGALVGMPRPCYGGYYSKKPLASVC